MNLPCRLPGKSLFPEAMPSIPYRKQLLYSCHLPAFLICSQISLLLKKSTAANLICWHLRTGFISLFQEQRHMLSGQHIGAGFSDNESGSLTFNVGKVTVRDHRLILSIDNRVPVTYSCHDVTLAVQKTIAKTPFSLEHEYATDSILIPRDSFLVTTLMDVYKRITGDINAKPEVDGGCTYARTMPNCVAFGALLPGQPNTMHEKNEGLHVRLIDTWMELYLEAIYQLAK